MNEIRDEKGMTEEEFLAAYRPGDYQKPSVAADTVIFTVDDKAEDNYRKLPEKELKILLIRRRSHPCIGMWALPGGFVEPDETTEQAAARELKEETGLDGIYLEQLYTFSDPGRDPRTWVMSCSYIALANSHGLVPHAGDDAKDARWFSVKLEAVSSEDKEIENGGVMRTTDQRLILSGGGEEISALVRRTLKRSPAGSENTCEILSTNGIAFDHAKIIVTALERLRGKVEYTDIALNLMPELFTLTQLQQVYEIILGRTLLKAPFRRKYSFLAEPTEMTTADVGHRPSRLYRRKWML